MDLQQIDKWHKTCRGHLSFGIIELAIGYGFASLAINYGSIWQYALGIIFIFGGFRNLIRIFLKPSNEHRKR